jgi:hypothetical protein
MGLREGAPENKVNEPAVIEQKTRIKSSSISLVPKKKQILILSLDAIRERKVRSLRSEKFHLNDIEWSLYTCVY